MTTKIVGGLQIPHPTFQTVDPETLEVPSISKIHPYHPGLGYLFDVSGSSSTWIQMDNNFIIRSVERESVTQKIVGLKVFDKSKKELVDCSGFLKITHLLDPITWIRGKYTVDNSHEFDFFNDNSQELPPKAREKMNDPMNQAYVEAIATYCLSKLREADVSPHFHKFYGAYRAVAEEYDYNISDVFQSYRHCRWFWKNQEEGIFELCTDRSDLESDVVEAIMDPPSELHSEASTRSLSRASDEEEELDALDEDLQTKVELRSLHSTGMESVEFKSEDEDADDEGEDDDDEEYEDENEDLNIMAKINNFPVMMMFTEPSTGTMDDLLNTFDDFECGPGDRKWEELWTAWIFQILAALSVLQSFFGFTHNDLHTNNIVWSSTEEKYFYYTNRDGTVWRIPTYGKVFRLIDFGRSIFWVNQKLFFSDDFKEGNDAAEQFSFGPLHSGDPIEDEVYPNPSFDLCRLAVSMFEGIFPVTPEKRKGGAVLSNEPGLLVRETKSNLYNLLWSWMIDDDGRNVLMEPDGRERYPDFDLYKVITQKVHCAVPKEQIMRPMFDQFRVGKKNVPKSIRLYNLFF